jgi:hypothetical protein
MSWAQDTRLRSRVFVSPRLMKVKSARCSRVPPERSVRPPSSRSIAAEMTITKRRIG